MDLTNDGCGEEGEGGAGGSLWEWQEVGSRGWTLGDPRDVEAEGSGEEKRRQRGE